MSDNSDMLNIKKTAEKYEITIPNVRPVDGTKFYDYERFVDFEDMVNVNQAIYKAKQGLFQVNLRMNEYDNKHTAAKTLYNRQWRRQYLGSTAKTDTARKAEADMSCETLEDDVIVYEQVKEDLKRVSNVLRIELQALQTISSNIRQQINI